MYQRNRYESGPTQLGRPWLPIDVPNCKLWVPAHSYIGADNDAVGTWPDLSGNNNHPTQGTTTRKAIYKTNILNGYPIMRADGTTRMSFTEITDIRACYAVVKKDDVSNSSTYITTDQSNTGYIQCSDENPGNTSHRGRISGQDIEAGPVFTVANTWHISAMISYGTYRIMRVDGVTVTWAAITGDHQVYQDLLYDYDAGYSYDGDMAECIIYTTADLTLRNMYLIERYLAIKYGLTTGLK